MKIILIFGLLNKTETYPFKDLDKVGLFISFLTRILIRLKSIIYT